MNDETVLRLAFDKLTRKIYRDSLSNPKKRPKLLHQLDHNPPFDNKYTKWFNSFQKAVDSIEVNNDSKVYLLSAAEEIDGKIMTYKEALDIIRYYGWGTIITISPEIALYYGELGERGAIIRKPLY